MMKLTDMVMERPAPRPRINYVREFAWRPIRTEDEGVVWLRHVWRIEAGGSFCHSCAILPL